MLNFSPIMLADLLSARVSAACRKAFSYAQQDRSFGEPCDSLLRSSGRELTAGSKSSE